MANLFYGYTDEQIEKICADGLFSILVQKEASKLFDGYDPNCYKWNTISQNDQCHKCYEWRRFPAWQRHLGFSWFRTCGNDCDCKHHTTEVLIG